MGFVSNNRRPSALQRTHTIYIYDYYVQYTHAYILFICIGYIWIGRCGCVHAGVNGVGVVLETLCASMPYLEFLDDKSVQIIYCSCVEECVHFNMNSFIRCCIIFKTTIIS